MESSHYVCRADEGVFVLMQLVATMKRIFDMICSPERRALFQVRIKSLFRASSVYSRYIVRKTNKMDRSTDAGGQITPTTSVSFS